MAEPKKPEAAAASAPNASPEEEANARVNTLRQQVTQLENELKSAEGKLKNRDPALLKTLQAENAALTVRIKELQKVALALILDARNGRSPEQCNQQAELLRLSAIEYFKRNNVDLELWKNIAS